MAKPTREQIEHGLMEAEVQGFDDLNEQAVRAIYLAMQSQAPNGEAVREDVRFLRHQAFAASKTTNARAQEIGQRLGEIADRLEGKAPATPKVEL